MNDAKERVRHGLEIESLQIEEFMSTEEIPAKVTGGCFDEEWVTYDLQTQMVAGLDRLRQVKRDLAMFLGVPEVRLDSRAGRLKLSVKQTRAKKLHLLDILSGGMDLGSTTVVLGLDTSGRPVLLNLLADDVNNILVAGAAGCGKSSLLRIIAVNLALTNRQSQVQLVLIDDTSGSGRLNSRNRVLDPLDYLPHLLFPSIRTAEGAADALRFLLEEMAYRQEQGIRTPLLVVLIDNVDELAREGGESVLAPLRQLLQIDEDKGLRMVLGAARPERPEIAPALKHNLAIRLVGRVESAKRARLLAGVPGTQAEYLSESGEFVAVARGAAVPFRAGYVSENDLHLIISRLHRQTSRVLLAKPVSRNGVSGPVEVDGETAGTFAYDGDRRRATLEVEPEPLDGAGSTVGTVLESEATEDVERAGGNEAELEYEDLPDDGPGDTSWGRNQWRH